TLLALASADRTRRLIVLDAATGRPVYTPEEPKDPVLGIAFHPDGKRLAAACGPKDGSICVYDLTTDRVVRRFAVKASVRRVAFSPDGKCLAAACQDGAVRLWDADTGDEILTLPAHTKAATGLAFSPDGRRLASAGQDGAVRTWDVITGRKLLEM